MLKRLLVPQHGYTRDSPQMLLLCQALARMGAEERRQFLAFATGCPHLPPGGLAKMHPPITVMRRSDNDADLTTASTCFRCARWSPSRHVAKRYECIKTTRGDLQTFPLIFQ